ncbi:chloride channel protein [Acidihalobacter ferrooxydans]|uniref:Chloride channel protein n=2 Tax=Acidihalobacter ferrooxydans TaxID=1765967 RepID=A0A1P8ULH5_9GAMM|nr:chloride channel protein [Acidihalobacter ferrooxydans]
MALLVGIIAGLGAVIFRDLIAFFHNLLFFGRISVEYDALVHTAASPWGIGIILVPMIGALAVAYLVKTFAPEAKGHGVPEVMYAIYYKRGIIRPQVALVKSLASSISIGSGGAIGREGPIIQIGAAFGSVLAQWTRVHEWERLALIAAGAGGGIAATFNTPIGGIVFAIELMMVEISARTLIPVMIATGTATFIGSLFFGGHPSFIIPQSQLGALTLEPTSVYLEAAVLGVLMGVLATVFTRSVYLFEDWFEAMPGNYYTRHVFGMALVGIIMYLMMLFTGHYYIEGVGYSTIQSLFDGNLNIVWLLLILVGLKLLATSLTLGSGASGGIFSPSLFIGAGAGAGFALLVQHVAPDMPLGPVGAAVIGMACMVGASTGAAVTAVVMIFEMTRDIHVIIPLIIAVSLAYGMRRLLLNETIYTLKLSRRGDHLPVSLHSPMYMMRSALELIRRPVVRLPASETLGEARALTKPRRPVPHVVLTEHGDITRPPLGVLSGQRLRAALKRLPDDTPLRELADTGYLVTDEHVPVFDLIADMRRLEKRNAVLTADGDCQACEDIIGVISHDDVIEFTNLPRMLTLRRTL